MSTAIGGNGPNGTYTRKALADVGRRFGRLVVVALAPNQKFVCRCDCGKTKAFFRLNVRRGASQSCGCLHAERNSAVSRTHGRSRSIEHRIWTGMRTRCMNPNVKSFKNYGGRGITVCDRWRSFEAFLSDMGPRPTPKHSIDRINNDGHYEPSNCRWATATEQRANRRDRKRAP